MKKLLLSLGLLLAVGGGCVNVGDLTGNLGGDKTVEGDWHLAFDLPSGWVMVEPYENPDVEAVVPNQEVDRDMTEVYLQSTDKAIVEGETPDGEVVPADTYVQEDFTQIRVTRLDTRRVIPSEAEDLGDGFFKLEDDFYLKTDDANYKFEIRGDDRNRAEDVIMSAEVVTEIDEVEDETAE
jgi:hypothetical protein